MSEHTSQFAGTEFEDAPFAGGDSDQGFAPPGRDRDLFGNTVVDCGPNGPYADIALTYGEWQVEINGEVMEFDVPIQQVSDIGLKGFGIALDDEEGEITLTGYRDDEQFHTGGDYELDCTVEVVAPPEGGVAAGAGGTALPDAGLDTGGLLLAGAVLLAGGVGVLRRFTA